MKLAAVREFAMALPEVTEEPRFGLRAALAPAMPNAVQDLIRAAWEGKIGKSAPAKSAKNAKKKTMRTAPAASRSRRTKSAGHD